MGPAGAGPTEDSCRSAAPGNERHLQSPNQTPGNIQAFRASYFGRSHRRIFRKDAAFSFYDLCLQCASGKTKCDSSAHSCGWHGTASNREPEYESTVLEASASFRKSDPGTGRVEYIFQR